MRPIPQTVQVASELSDGVDDFDLLAHLQGVADEVQAVVPDCVGLSVAWTECGVAFSLASSDEEVAVLDAVQYLSGGPCVEAVERGAGLHWSVADPLDEKRWQGFAQATAARAVRSTLTVPLVSEGAVVGSANLYAASDNVFEGHAEVLAGILGGSAGDVVRNADLSFSTRGVAEGAPEALRRADTFNMAVGLLIGTLDVDAGVAERRLVHAAARARLSPTQLAQAIVALHS